ncbi:MAG TPA: F0F1 ATP synthase subunit B [Saprospiraceae bacterium]|nr:F0F1 ATP synthase subunit B [Saprospiraceae bacterium]HMP12720.1 F0F1 ATP synthase subunit B [Saprospiraceae bacterium]
MSAIIFLADFSVMKPEPGLLLWTIIIFALFWMLMARFAFKPIQNALKQREVDIQQSLDEAKKAREEMANLKSENEQLLRQAQEERMKILKEANEAKETIINEAKTRAKEEAQKIVASAKEQIENQRMAAITDIKNQTGMVALEIAEKLIRRQLKGDAEQEQFVKTLLEEMKLN